MLYRICFFYSLKCFYLTLAFSHVGQGGRVVDNFVNDVIVFSQSLQWTRSKQGSTKRNQEKGKIQSPLSGYTAEPWLSSTLSSISRVIEPNNVKLDVTWNRRLQRQTK